MKQTETIYTIPTSIFVLVKQDIDGYMFHRDGEPGETIMRVPKWSESYIKEVFQSVKYPLV